VKRRSDRLFCTDTDHVEPVSEFVRNLQLQILPGLEFAIDIAEQLSGYDGRFLPSGMLVTKFFAFGVEMERTWLTLKKYLGIAGKCMCKQNVPGAA